MRAWGKRMIWFFGISIIMFLSELMDYLTGFVLPEEQVTSAAFFWIILIVLPLIMMDDDSQSHGKVTK